MTEAQAESAAGGFGFAEDGEEPIQGHYDDQPHSPYQDYAQYQEEYGVDKQGYYMEGGFPQNVPAPAEVHHHHYYHAPPEESPERAQQYLMPELMVESSLSVTFQSYPAG